MHLNVIALIVLLIGSFHFKLSLGLQSEVDPDLIPIDIEQLCVGRDVCVKSTVTTNTPACCQDCSCDVECRDTNNCCYPSMNNDSYRQYQTCQYITLESTRSSRRRASVFMITEKPEGGCVNESITDCCDGVEYPWGSMFPVISRTTGIVYKNDRYALCHGDTDFEHSEIYLLCDNIGHASLSDGCMLRFATVETVSNVCFMDERSICPVDFEVEPSLNLTKEEIRLNCKRDFVSVFGFYFKSVYCYLCQMDFYVPFYCPTNSVPLRAESFVNVLDIRSWSEQFSGPQTLPAQPEVCDVTGLSKVKQICRPLMCPEGQIWVNGCEYISSMWSVNRLKLIVEVRLPRGVTISKQSFQQLVANVTSPWPSSEWELQSYLYRYGQHQAELTKTTSLPFEEATDTNRNISSFFVTLRYRRLAMIPEQFLSETRENLDNSWTMTYGVDRLVLSQALSTTSFEEVEVISESSTDQMYVEKWAFSDVRQNLTITTYQLFDAIVVKEDESLHHKVRQINVTKMLFCNQIALLENEVTMFRSRRDNLGAALMVRKTGSLLYNQAFKIVNDGQNTFSYLVCTEDYYLNSTTMKSEGTRMDCETPVVLMFMLFVMTLIIANTAH